MIEKPKKLGPLPKSVVNEMRQIIQNIENDVYHHDQTQWHCGTSHCFAGFKEIRDYAKEKATTKRQRLSIICETDVSSISKALWLFRLDKIPQETGGVTTMQYAGRAWGLTHDEATKLFDGSSDLDDIREMVSQFGKGLRFLYGSEWIDPKVYTTERYNAPDMTSIREFIERIFI